MWDWQRNKVLRGFHFFHFLIFQKVLDLWGCTFNTINNTLKGQFYQKMGTVEAPITAWSRKWKGWEGLIVISSITEKVFKIQSCSFNTLFIIKIGLNYQKLVEFEARITIS